MSKERSIDTLAKWVMAAMVAALVLAVCWYFRAAILYIILAAVVSLIGKSVMNLLRKIRVKGRCAPDALLAVVTIILLIICALALFTQIIPVVVTIISDISANFAAVSDSSYQISNFTDKLNEWVTSTIPGLDSGFSIEKATQDFLAKQFNASKMTAFVGSLASGLGNFFIGAFSVVFISFFFIKDDKLFRKIIAAIVPDKYENSAIEAIGDIEHLLSRYFVGMILEVLCVSLLNFLGLSLIARISTSTAIGLAFMTGVLNIIPYLGPWIGGAIGAVLGTVLTLSAGAAAGTSVNVLVVAAVLIAIFVFTQMVDNFFLQPMIYSASIKASPLEIFIVLILAGHVGGIFGMIAAIPAYTVIRVIAIHFFYDVKAIQRLIPEKDILEERSRNS